MIFAGEVESFVADISLGSWYGRCSRSISRVPLRSVSVLRGSWCGRVNREFRVLLRVFDSFFCSWRRCRRVGRVLLSSVGVLHDNRRGRCSRVF